MKAAVVLRLRWLFLLLVLVAAACGASDEELRLEFLLENPMASASLPFAEPSGRVEREGDFDPWLGSAEGSLVSFGWDLEEDQIGEALEILVEQAEMAGFEMELSVDGAASGRWLYRGTSADRTCLTIASGGPNEIRSARVSVSLE